MNFGTWLRPRDARGRESRTLTFVVIAFCLMSARFFFGGFSADFGGFRVEVGATAMVDYGVAVAAILAAWLGREWLDAKRGKTDV